MAHALGQRRAVRSLDDLGGKANSGNMQTLDVANSRIDRNGGVKMKNRYFTFVMGMLVGAVLFGGGTAYAAGVIAELSVQPIYVDGQQRYSRSFLTQV